MKRLSGREMPIPDNIQDFSLREADEVANALGTDLETGLTADAVKHRLAEEGPNELRATLRQPLWRRVMSHFQDPLVYLLLAAVAISLSAWFVEGSAGWPVDAVVIGVVVLLNGMLGFVQEAKAENAVAALGRMTAVSSSVIREGKVMRVPSSQLVRGDLLLLGEGDAVGADARLVRAASLRVQEASLTGESEAVLKDLAALPGPVSLADQVNMVFKGTAVVQGTARAIVTATGMATQMGSIAGMLDATKEEATPLQKEIARIGRMLGMAVVVIALIVVGTILLLSDIRTTDVVVDALLVGVSLAVAAVPEGLPGFVGRHGSDPRHCPPCPNARVHNVRGQDPGLAPARAPLPSVLSTPVPATPSMLATRSPRIPPPGPATVPDRHNSCL
jgi:magnesium-transporting ATPase (P-type)